MARVTTDPPPPAVSNKHSAFITIQLNPIKRPEATEQGLNRFLSPSLLNFIDRWALLVISGERTVALLRPLRTMGPEVSGVRVRQVGKKKRKKSICLRWSFHRAPLEMVHHTAPRPKLVSDWSWSSRQNKENSSPFSSLLKLCRLKFRI